MSQENVEAVKESMAAYNRRDFDAAAELFDPEIEWVLPAALGADSCRGPEEVKRLWLGIDEAFEGFRLEPEEFIDAGDHVPVRLRYRGRGKASGLEIEQEVFSQVITFRGGRIVRVDHFTSWDKALEAAGLSE
jgi:ketosteroid isomerase-like protein